MKIRIAYVRVFVSDLERALKFYIQTLGLESAFVDNEMGWAQLKTEGTTLALEQISAADNETNQLIGRYLGVSLSVDEDLENIYKDLSAKGIPFSGPPQVMPWGGLMTQISDPDDNVLTLMESPEVSRWRMATSDGASAEEL